MANKVTIELVQKESKTLTFTIKDSDGALQNLTGGTFTLYGKRLLNSGTTYLFEKANSSFNIASVAVGVISVPLTTSDLDFTDNAYGILVIDMGSGNLDKNIFKITMEESPE